MSEENYSSAKRISDRREGRLLGKLPAFVRITPYIQRRRSDAAVSLTDCVEVSGIEQWLREKRGEGWAGLGFLHLLVAAYVRTVSMRPGINRFVAGRKIYARNTIEVCMNVKRGPSVTASESCIKVSFSPSATVFDVYRTLSSAVDALRADVRDSDAERIAGVLCRFPRFALRFVMLGLRILDYFDWLPAKYLSVSPFHGSLSVIDFGSLGVAPAAPSLPDFGTLPCAISFGTKRRVHEPDVSGSRELRYVDFCITADGRICDSYYFASALKCLKYFLKNPKELELPPQSVEDDVN